MKLNLFFLGFILLSSFVYPQEQANSTIIIFSDPGNVRVKIPQLDLDIDKPKSEELVLSGIPDGEIKLKFSYLQFNLRHNSVLPLNDTLVIYANFFRDEVFAATMPELKKLDNQNEYKRFILNHLNKNNTDNDNEIVTEFADEEVFYVVEDMPTFNGSHPAIEFKKFIADNLRYPDSAAEEGISGRVIVQFMVDKNGRVMAPTIVSGVHPDLDAEVIRVVMSSPPWNPGRQRGEAVNVLFTFPVSFVLPSQNNSKTGTILIYSKPENIKIRIPELDMKMKKKGAEPVILSNIDQGQYTFSFTFNGYSLEEAYYLPAQDTLTVLADFYQMGTVSALALEVDSLVTENKKLEATGVTLHRNLDGVNITSIGVRRDEYYGSGRYIEEEDIREAIVKTITSKEFHVGLKEKGQVINFNELFSDSLSISPQEDEEFADEEVFYIVEEMPTFNGGDPALEFRKFIAYNLRYPDSAAEKGISGRVIVQFMVDKNGRVKVPTIVSGVHPVLDAEAIRVVMSSPPWAPGRQRGEAVNVLFTFPINFVLQ